MLPRNKGTFVTSETKYYQGTEAPHGSNHGTCIATAQMVALVLGLDPRNVLPFEATANNQSEIGRKMTQRQTQRSSVRRNSPISLNQIERKRKTMLQYRITTNAALLYRLSGDYNPIHVEGDLLTLENGNAKGNAGEGSAVLHGLCTMGYAVRAILHHAEHHHTDKQHVKEVCLASVRCTFVKPVYVGDTIRVDVWDKDDGACHDKTKCGVCFQVYRDVDSRACSDGHLSDTKRGSDLVVDKGEAHFRPKRSTDEGAGNISRL